MHSVIPHRAVRVAAIAAAASLSPSPCLRQSLLEFQVVLEHLKDDLVLELQVYATTLRLCGVGDQTRGLIHARQAFYQESYNPSTWVFACSVCAYKVNKNGSSILWHNSFKECGGEGWELGLEVVVAIFCNTTIQWILVQQ